MRHLGVIALALALPTAALAQTAPLLVMPDGARPARRTVGALVDCAEHGAWSAPDGWSTATHDGIVIATAPDGSAMLARAPARPRLRDDDAFLALTSSLVARLAGARPVLAPIQATDRNRWRRERAVEGTVARGGITLRVLARASRTQAVWVALHRDGDTAARAAIDASIAGWRMLVSHACACGYDCAR